MADRLLGLHILITIIIIIFFLVTLGCSIFFTMVIFSSRVSGEQAGNLMVFALVPPSILTVVFLHKVAGKLYDRLNGATIKSSLKKWIRKTYCIWRNQSSRCTIHRLQLLVIFFLNAYRRRDLSFPMTWKHQVVACMRNILRNAFWFWYDNSTLIQVVLSDLLLGWLYVFYPSCLMGSL